MTTAFPSEALVVYSDYQQLTSLDLNDAASIPQASTDNVVAAFLAAGQGYTGLAVSTNQDALGVTVGPGILFNAGGGFPLRAPQNIDLTPQINLIPDNVSSQVVLIVASVGTADLDETRTLEDASRKPTNPADLWSTVQEVLTTRRVRSCTANIVAGPVAATAPLVPPYNPLLCLLATVVINKTGVVSLVQSAAQRITRLDQLVPIVTGLATSSAGYNSAIAGLLATVAAMKATYDGKLASLSADLLALRQDFNNLVNKVASRPATGAGSGGSSTTIVYSYTDYYEDATGLTVQPNNPTYSTGGGLGFPQSGTAGTIVPINPYAGNIATPDNKLLPAYTEEVVYSAAQPSPKDVAFNGFASLTVLPQQMGFGLFRLRYGASLPAQAQQNLLANGDPAVIWAQTPGSLSYDPTWPDWRSAGPELIHQNGYYTDLTGRGPWTSRIPKLSTGGLACFATGMLVGRDMMMTGFDLSVGRGTFGDIRMLIVRNLTGSPAANIVGDPGLNPILADVTCPFASIDPTKDIDGLYGVAPFNLPHPIYVPDGCFALFMTSGDHKVRGLYVGDTTPTSPLVGIKVPSGTFQWNRVLYFGGVACRIRAARFGATQTEVPLQPVFAAQTDRIDVLLPAIVPPGAAINLALQGSGTGGAYIPLGPIDPNNPATNLLAGRPSTLPLALELSGTVFVQPIINLGVPKTTTPPASVAGAKQGATLSAESRVFQLLDQNKNPLAFTRVIRSVTLIGYDPTLHSYGEQLETGASYGTVTPPAGSLVPMKQADGTYLVTYSWTLGSSVTSAKVAMSGTTSDATKTFRLRTITTIAP